MAQRPKIEPNTTPIRGEMATKKQVDFLTILLNDAGMSTRALYLDYLQVRGYTVRYLDELTKVQAMALISKLKDEKDEDEQYEDVMTDDYLSGDVNPLEDYRKD